MIPSNWACKYAQKEKKINFIKFLAYDSLVIEYLSF